MKNSIPEIGKKYHVLNGLREPVEVIIIRHDEKRKESLIQGIHEDDRGYVKWSRILQIKN